MFGLDALLEVYPDARIVWTHRDPGKVIPSSVSFVGTLRTMNSPVFDPRRFGAEWTALEEMGLQRALAVRDRVGDDRFLDVHYNDLIADPVAEVTRIYQHFGIPADDEAVAGCATSTTRTRRASTAPTGTPRSSSASTPSASGVASRPTANGSASSPTARAQASRPDDNSMTTR